jgi:HK97 family phage major capsid protein
MDKIPDFSGWVTRNNLRCSDGRTILRDAFKDDDKKTVPLIWSHRHNNPDKVLGHAILENRDEGVYANCFFNETDTGKTAKALVEHGDISALSIYANNLKQQGSSVLHGVIREVSLVLAGANPGAFIDSVFAHEDAQESDEAIIYTGEEIVLEHAENTKVTDKNTSEDEETVADVFDTLSEKQKLVVYAMLEEALKTDNNKKATKIEEDVIVKHNVFDQDKDTNEITLSHSDALAIIADAKRSGSMKEAAIAHGITDIEYLFPDAKGTANMPEFITRDQAWVKMVMDGTHHTPFSRVKSIFANLTEAEARAKGYIKGRMKTDEVFSLLKRSTSPTTIYKKQTLDRDDVVDITDFDVVAWLKHEMRMMLNEEIARAILVGDGRLSSSDDKIDEQRVRPIWTDVDLYTIHTSIAVPATATADQRAKAIIRAAVKSRKLYKGSGNPVFFTTEDVLTDMLLMEDAQGRVIYESKEKLATALLVRDIVTVPVMDGLTRANSENKTVTLAGIIVNLSDYNVGADKGGAINMFDDFDIDYNQQKYLIETRCSGALIKPYSAIALELGTVSEPTPEPEPGE